MERIQFLIFLLFSLKEVYGIPTHVDYGSQGSTVGTCSGVRSTLPNSNQYSMNLPHIKVEQKADCDFYQAVAPVGKPGDPGFRQCRSRDHEGSASLPKLPQCGGRSELPLYFSQCPCAVKGQGAPQRPPLPTLTLQDLTQQPSFCPSDLEEGPLRSVLKPQCPPRQALSVCSPPTHNFLRTEEVDDERVCRKPSDRNVGGPSKGPFSIPSSNKGTSETNDIHENGRDIPNACGLYFS